MSPVELVRASSPQVESSERTNEMADIAKVYIEPTGIENHTRSDEMESDDELASKGW